MLCWNKQVLDHASVSSSFCLSTCATKLFWTADYTMICYIYFYVALHCIVWLSVSMDHGWRWTIGDPAKIWYLLAMDHTISSKIHREDWFMQAWNFELSMTTWRCVLKVWFFYDYVFLNGWTTDSGTAEVERTSNCSYDFFLLGWGLLVSSFLLS